MSRTVNVQGVGRLNFPDDATDEEIQKAISENFPAKQPVAQPAQEPLPETSAFGAFARQAVQGIPSGIAAGAGGKGGAALLSETGPLGMFVGGAAGATALGLGESALQEHLTETYAPGLARLNVADVQQHPLASAAGRLLSGAAAFKFDPFQSARGLRALPKLIRGVATPSEERAAIQTAVQLGAQTGITAGTDIIQGRAPTPGELAESAAFALLYGEGRGPLGTHALTKGQDATRVSTKPGEVSPTRVVAKGRKKKSGDQMELGTPEQPEPVVEGEETPTFPEGKSWIATTPEGKFVVRDNDYVYTPEYEARSHANEAQKELTDAWASKPQRKPQLEPGRMRSRANEVREKLNRERKAKGQPLIPDDAPKKKGKEKPAAAPAQAEQTPEEIAADIEAERRSIAEAEAAGTESGPERVIKEAGKAKGMDVRVEDVDEKNPDLPFHKRQTAWSNPDGSIGVNRQQLKQFVLRMSGRGLPVERMVSALQTVVDEEHIHSKTPGDVAERYWNQMTRLEKMLVERGYGRTEEQDGARLMGYEAVRRQIQRIARSPLTEVVEFSGREHWTQRAISMLEEVIFRIRRALGTNASRLQQEYLDNVMGKLKAAEEAVPRGGESPAAFARRKKKETELERATRRLQETKQGPPGPRGYAPLAGEAERQRQDLSQAWQDYFNAKFPEQAPPEEDRPAALSRKKRIERDRERLEAMREAARAAQRPPQQLEPTQTPFREVPQEELIRRRDELRAAGGPPSPELDAITKELVERSQRTTPFRGMTREQLVARREELRSAKDFGPEFNAITDELIERGMGQRTTAAAEGAVVPGTGKAPVDITTGRLFETGQRGMPGQEQQVERPSGEELGVLPRPTAMDLTGEEPGTVLGDVTKTGPQGEVQKVPGRLKMLFTGPNSTIGKKFNQLFDWVRNNQGVVDRESLKDLFRQGYTEHLTNASGARLAEWVKGQNLESDVGWRRRGALYGDVRERPIADPAGSEKSIGLLPGIVPQEVEPGERDVFAARRTRPGERAQQYRRTVISAIMRKLERDMVPEAEVTARNEVSIDDLDFQNRNTEFGAWRRISRAEAGDPKKLGAILSDQARRHGESAANTRRLVALQNDDTGEIVLVSTWPKPHVGPMVIHPSGSTGIRGKPNVPLSQVSNKWRPFYSGLLRDPVVQLYKRFDNRAEFDTYISKQAEEEAMQHQPGVVSSAGRRARAMLGVEGMDPGDERTMATLFLGKESDFLRAGGFEDVPEGIMERFGEYTGENLGRTGVEEGQGGGFTGPEADIYREGTGERVRAMDIPLTSTEAWRVMDYLLDPHKGGAESFEALTPKHMDDVIERIQYKADYYKMKPADWQFVLALQKAAYAIHERSTHPSMDEAYAQAIKEFYETVKNSGNTREDFIQEAMVRFGKKGEATGEAPSAAQPAEAGAREIFGPGPRPVSARERLLRAARPTPPITAGFPGKQTAIEALRQRETLETPPPITEAPPYEPTTRPLFPGGPVTESQVGGPGEAVPPRGAFAGEPRYLPHEPTPGRPYGRSGPKISREAPPVTGERKQPPGQLRLDISLAEGQPREERRGTGVTRPRPLRGAQGELDLPAAFARRTPGEVFDELDANARDEWNRISTRFNAHWERKDVIKAIPVLTTSMQNAAATYSANVGMGLKLTSGRPISEAGRKPYFGIGGLLRPEARAQQAEAEKLRGAARAMMAVGWQDDQGNQHYNPHGLGDTWEDRKGKSHTGLQGFVDLARARAELLLESKNPTDRRTGRAWAKAADRLDAEIQYARDHWNDPKLREYVDQFRRETDREIDFENANGGKVTRRENYVPSIFEKEWFDDDGVWMRGIGGKQFRAPRKFEHVYEAISKGPYIPASYDTAQILQNRIYNGRIQIARRMGLKALRALRDPLTNKPVAVGAVPVKEDREVKGPNGMVTVEEVTGHHSGALDRTLVPLGPGQTPISVLNGYERVVRDVMSTSAVPNFTLFDVPVGAAALNANRMLKHGVILAFDFFHPGRLFQYAAAIGGKDWKTFNMGFNGGWTALNIEAKDIPKAVEQGLVTKEAASWATEQHDVKQGNRVVQMTNQEIMQKMLARHGLNATSINDAIYKDAIKSIPIIGEQWHKILSPINRFVFDRMTPGLMAQSAVENFKRLNAARPDIPISKLMRDVSRDVNLYYGNLGNMGVFRNPTMRDLANLTLLAPMWQEGIVGKELVTYSRLLGMGARAVGEAIGKPIDYRKGLPQMGALGRGVVRGLLAYVIGTQLINLITRGQLTFQNPEKEHKLDAFIPSWTGEGQGLWLSPASVFAEVLHDMVRLGSTKKNVYEALLQMGENRLGPLGRMEQIVRTGRTPTGVRPRTTAGVALAALDPITPAPISIGRYARAVGHAIAPDYIAPTRPGELQRQTISTFAGIKTEVARTDEQQVRQMADDFMESQNLKAHPYEQIPTDEPSYTKLRGAIRNGDDAGARQILAGLQQHHNDKQIMHAMMLWAKHPFTGSHDHEKVFLSTLNDDELELYWRANMERQDDLLKFYEFFMKNAER